MRQTIPAKDYCSAAPPPGAGTSVYDPPVVHGGGPPSHTPRPARPQHQWSWMWSGVLILLNVVAHAVHDWSGLTQLESFMLLYGFASVFGYWIGERPQQSFPSWALKVIGIWLNCYVGFVTVPESLRGLIPEPLAFGLPAFFVTLIFYRVPPLKPHGRRSPLWQWLLWAAGFAAVWGWLGPGLVE